MLASIVIFLLFHSVLAPEAWAGEMDPSTLARKLILNLYGDRQERLDLLKYLTSPQVRERMRKASLDLHPVVRAMQVREFNREMIADLKEKGWVGETAQAALAIPPAAMEKLTAEDLLLVREVLKEENEGRQVLIRLLSLLQEGGGAEPSPSDPAREGLKEGGWGLEAVRQQWGDLGCQVARPGEWVRGADGLWIRKR